MTLEMLLAGAALIIALLALWAALTARRTARRVANAVLGDVDSLGSDDNYPEFSRDGADTQNRGADDRSPQGSGVSVVSPPPMTPPVIVVNPTKTDVRALRHIADRTTSILGFPEARIVETTIEDPGTGQARQAVEDGAQVAIAAGGDGTVRAVAEGLMHSKVPMGLLPLGTGNLLATNLNLTGISDRELLTIALTGRDRPMDMGIIRTEALTPSELEYLSEAKQRDDTFGVHAPTEGAEAAYLVIAGLGFDAVMVGGADEDVKRRFGIIAYPVNAVRHMFDHKIRAQLELNAQARAAANPDQDVPLLHVHARSIMFANCGRLMSGVTLVPNAQLDDGWLDVVVMDTRGGVKGWMDLTNKVLLQGAGWKSNFALLKHARIDTTRARTATVRTHRPHPVQVDGDIIALATTIHTEVQPDALLVRTPR